MTDLASASSSRTPFRAASIVSDGTGVTVETFNHSILAQFGMRFRQMRIPFVDTIDKAHVAITKISEALHAEGARPVVFITLVDAKANEIVHRAKATALDMFQTFIGPLEKELNFKSIHAIGRFHQSADTEAYKSRIGAIDFSLTHDDGQSHKNLVEADVILVGVSHSGKMPTSLYPAMQYGVRSTNYPLIPDDFERSKLLLVLYDYESEIFGPSIDPQRLPETRDERRSDNKYIALENCHYEISEVEAMMRREGIKWLSPTCKSIEEVTTTILQDIKMNHSNYQAWRRPASKTIGIVPAVCSPAGGRASQA